MAQILRIIQFVTNFRHCHQPRTESSLLRVTIDIRMHAQLHFWCIFKNCFRSQLTNKYCVESPQACICHLISHISLLCFHFYLYEFTGQSWPLQCGGNIDVLLKTGAVEAASMCISVFRHRMETLGQETFPGKKKKHRMKVLGYIRRPE